MLIGPTIMFLYTPTNCSYISQTFNMPILHKIWLHQRKNEQTSDTTEYPCFSVHEQIHNDVLRLVNYNILPKLTIQD